jgi:hypothetical protein
MSKVSIGLRGWRFDEDEVFTDEGELKPFDEMPPEVRTRVIRLHRLVEAPCDACWLIHGDAEVHRCNVATVVYGEPFAEVVLCREHERDFVYWYREEGGNEYRGTENLEDAFHEWFAEGNRAPEDYGNVEHVDTDPDGVPVPPTDGTAGGTCGVGGTCGADLEDDSADSAGADDDSDIPLEFSP